MCESSTAAFSLAKLFSRVALGQTLGIFVRVGFWIGPLNLQGGTGGDEGDVASRFLNHFHMRVFMTYLSEVVRSRKSIWTGDARCV